MKQEELKQKYPEAYAEVMSNPMKNLWDFMQHDMKETVLIGITKKMESKK